MNNLPFNGRIAIIDDQLEQAIPLINILSKHKRPLMYFSGELKFLPTKEDNINDIRVLFLDINLIDDSEHEDKVLKSKLIPVLEKVISETNFPYVIIYWSREDKKLKDKDKYKHLVEDIFTNDLKTRKPIGFLSADKIQFFNSDGTKTDEFDNRINELFDKVSNLIGSIPNYNYLLNWEGLVHHSADKTLQDIFSSYHQYENWSDNANFLINKMGESYAGRSNYKSQDASQNIKSSFLAFNNVFTDSLDYAVNSQELNIENKLVYDENLIQAETIYTINKKLLLSDDKEPFEYSGAVTEDQNPKSDKVFEELLNNAFNRKVAERELANDEDGTERTKKALGKAVSDLRQEIRASWKKVYFVITPLCDYVQSKYYNVKTIKGIVIKAKYIKYIEDKSEAVFISPKFQFDGETYVIVLHFRYFFTSGGSKNVKHLVPLFRVRQQLLAEIQSKLARHINRQGILYLE
ncbi:hypothetical protein [Mucilaginibacter lappiensis]|uniref:Response receiver domain-containing protein n=1 Tax=Mucilaginibacter lappiensis TaxID=354630 RepID=A0A841JCU7_9SPHI|nr:hypothetical protein [Mucilaginibacter lappiensis]MBB6128630.1 hypothetical protein [Mucilaginibacter lappiensis]